jgi:hypothetical protein
MSLIHCCLFGTIEYLAIWFGVLIKTVEMETITNIIDNDRRVTTPKSVRTALHQAWQAWMIDKFTCEDSVTGLGCSRFN